MPARPRVPAAGTPGRGARVLTRTRALRADVKRVERLAGRHEQPVALRAAEANVTADLRQPDTADQLALRGPHGDTAVADVAAGVRGAPHVAVHVAAHTVRPALDTVDHEIAEELAVGGL